MFLLWSRGRWLQFSESVLHLLAQASARMGDMQRCMSWMQRAEASERLDAKAYYSLISACAQAGDVAAARKALEEMKGKGPGGWEKRRLFLLVLS